MTKNVGGVDRKIRMVLGLAIIGAGVFYNNYWGALGLIPLGTGLIGWCPPYAIFGINSCSVKNDG